MRYSFTSPLPKSIISRLTKIWIFYIILSVMIVYLSGLYLNIERNTLRSNMEIAESNINTQDEQIAKIQADINRLQYELNLDNTNKFYNSELKSALLKLFELIPNQITITQISLEEKRLVLKGITPSREIYSFLLQAPLKSIFTTSRVDFFPLPNGWYNFTSISVLKEEQ
ncbi:hypothetical protein CCY99_02090 [Helicobacter sp. 16-1353]|uniref:hypothetical protein n=1 Tax=Helicobacter sp. 16-1353 TaxID=2004996 RepID=UPI000DCD5FBA|nr:hypothetical protein [Helicobacter sp. 16-1353]RAX54955.1 hypothetical protein CCY99_02090 [Helicobacter sp. 16-1353]